VVRVSPLPFRRSKPGAVAEARDTIRRLQAAAAIVTDPATVSSLIILVAALVAFVAAVVAALVAGGAA
jgi:hypothetical protein